MKKAVFGMIIAGMGWFVWSLCRPGLSVPVSLMVVAGAYALGGLIAYVGSMPGVGCIPVKFDRRD